MVISNNLSILSKNLILRIYKQAIYKVNISFKRGSSGLCFAQGQLGFGRHVID